MRCLAQTRHDLRFDRKRHRFALKGLRRDRTGHTVEFKDNTAWLYARGPIFDRTLALALTNFRRLLRNWNVREYSNPQTTLPANVASNRAASRFDLACRDTFRFQGRSAIRAEVEGSTAGRITLDPPFE